MPAGPSATVATHFQTLFQVGALAGLTDGELLARFVEGPRETAEAAFTAIVDRHGPMVLRTCRQITGNLHDADDAAQATFLVLARRARSLRSNQTLAGWLHEVARRTSAHARADTQRRRDREHQAAQIRSIAAPPDPEPRPELHEELARLPERFRLPILLCHLEGLTHEQAALQLNCPIRTLQSRLARGRKRLRSRLLRRGFGPAAALLVVSLAPEAASAAWATAAAQASARFALGGTASISPTINLLAQGALMTMFWTKWKAIAAVAVLCGIAAGGVVVLAQAPPQSPAARHTAPAPSPFRITTPGGVTVEVIGVSTTPSGPNTWWKPDGSPLREPPLDPSEAPLPEEREKRNRDFAVRCTPPTGDVTDLGIEVNNVVNERLWKESPVWKQRQAFRDGRAVPGLFRVGTILPKDGETCTISWVVASGPWINKVAIAADGTYSTSVMRQDILTSKSRELAGRTSMVVAEAITGSDVRIVAIGRDGRTITPSYKSRRNTYQFQLHDVEFNQKLSEIKEFQVQARPIEHVRLENIALRPRPLADAP